VQPKLKAAREVLRREAALYDGLSRRPRYVTEPPHIPLNSEAYSSPLDHGRFQCLHEVSLCEPCEKCHRSESDCIEYRVERLAKVCMLLQTKAL
jgi:hypothetical protein